MQIVIDISEKDYQLMKDGHIPFSILDVIMNGTPLPKGHGRLIDADALMEYCQNYKSKVIDCNDIARFPTIIRREGK